MRKLYIILLAITLTTTSCMKEFERKHTGPDNTGVIPADFAWSTVRDVTATVGMPTVDGAAPEFAIVRFYSSPVIAENREIALGVLSPATPSFQTAFTIPDGVTTVYVKTTLPDGTSSVRSADVSNGRLDMPGAQMTGASPARILFAEEAATPKSTSMPKYPTLPEKGQSDFDSRAVISETPAKEYSLGTDWNNAFPADEYYIPAGAEINGKIDLNGYQGKHPNPVLYVKGKLTLSSPQIGGTLAILPGGEVTVTGTLAARAVNEAPHPAIYVFKGGKLTTGNANLSCESIVNNGTLHVDGKLDTNNQVVIYNGTDGELSADKFYISNNGTLYNDGKIDVEDFELNSKTTFENCENGVVEIDKMSLTNGNSTVFTQKGKANIDEMKCTGIFNVYCYTYIDELTTDNSAKVNIAADACLETKESEFNNTHISMAGGSLFIAKEYNLNEKGGNNCYNDSSNKAVFRIEEKAIISKSAQTQFSGPIEVVYDNAKVESKYQIDDHYVKTSFKGAYLADKQTVNIPASECNGGKGVITPDPETKPDEVVTVGETYTYCFEDGWPWLCDYDMNDVVVPISIERRMSDGGKNVEWIRINWEVKASGAKHRLAMAVQLDQVKTNQIASVETTNDKFGTGPFAGPGCEAGNENAVIPFFNSINETQSAGETFFNTEKDRPTVETTKHTTTIRFTSPVDVNSVLESTMNVFIVVNRGTTGDIGRGIEVHLPAFKPTKFGDISNINSIQPGMPYKFYSPTTPGDSGMMWGLMIPGTFRYPTESSDIRNVYTYFRSWATSGGAVHKEWYLENTNKVLLY